MTGREQLHSECLLQNEVVFRKKKTVPVEVGERFRLTDSKYYAAFGPDQL